MKIVYLKPRASFRDNLRSDTLWGLICWGIKTVYSEKELEKFISGYSEGKVVKISSSFRYITKDDKKELYFPRPILKPLNLNEFFEKNDITLKKEKADYITKIKKFKKATIVNKENFLKFLSGEFNEQTYFLSKEWEKRIDPIKREDVLHNSINRLTNTTSKDDASLYTTSESFAKDGGLFFLIDGDEEQIKIVEGALRYFDHIGFGGDASIGKNSFDVTTEDFSFPEVNDANAFITLSLYSPASEEINNFAEEKENVWYDLETRKGKFGGQYVKAKSFWKDSIIMFKEGSVFNSLNKENYGENKIVKQKSNDNDFNIYQYGYAFNLPIKLK